MSQDDFFLNALSEREEAPQQGDASRYTSVVRQHQHFALDTNWDKPYCVRIRSGL